MKEKMLKCAKIPLLLLPIIFLYINAYVLHAYLYSLFIQLDRFYVMVYTYLPFIISSAIITFVVIIQTKETKSYINSITLCVATITSLYISLIPIYPGIDIIDFRLSDPASLQIAWINTAMYLILLIIQITNKFKRKPEK